VTTGHSSLRYSLRTAGLPPNMARSAFMPLLVPRERES
jgi:hypothetical protein